MTGAPNGLRVAGALARREVVAFLRRPVRVAAALGTAILLWLFAASGLSAALQPGTLGDSGYGLFLMPGMITLVAVFASIFSSISVIEERQSGWLQSVLVSPAPRWSIALGKAAGGAAVAFLQAVVLLPALPLVGEMPGLLALAQALAALAVTCVALSAVGLAFAWASETTAGFHAVMNLVFMPMWLLSGSLFPAQGASRWLAFVVAVNPLSWCTEAIRSPLAKGEPAPVNFMLAALFAVGMVVVATVVVGGRRRA